MSHTLTLAEEVLLLALDDEKGTLPEPNGDLAVAAAVLVGLLDAGRIALGGDGAVAVLDGRPTGDPGLDLALARLADGKPADLKTWIQRFAEGSDLREATVERLVVAGVLERREGAFFGLGPDRYPERYGVPEDAVVDRLARAITTDDEVDRPTRLLLSIADAAQLLPLVLDRKELKRRAERIEALTDGEAVGDAVRAALDEFMALITITVINATTT